MRLDLDSPTGKLKASGLRNKLKSGHVEEVPAFARGFGRAREVEPRQQPSSLEQETVFL